MDELKEEIKKLSDLMSGPIEVHLIYDPTGTDQKLFITSVVMLTRQQ